MGKHKDQRPTALGFSRPAWLGAALESGRAASLRVSKAFRRGQAASWVCRNISRFWKAPKAWSVCARVVGYYGTRDETIDIFCRLMETFLLLVQHDEITLDSVLLFDDFIEGVDRYFENL